MNSPPDYPDARLLHHGLMPKRFEAIASSVLELYPQGGELIIDRLVALLSRFQPTMRKLAEQNGKPLWDENDVVLITYGDSLHEPGSVPLAILKKFADKYLQQAISRVHILPFFPWSSDDGFSVIDYRLVDASLGTWQEVEALGENFGLMFDLVLNHCSSRSPWFEQFSTGILPYSKYFMTVAPGEELGEVVRPRTSPLLTPFETRQGSRLVWTTFSSDQVDFDWRNPDVCFEFLDVLLGYALRGASIIRLDAVAFLWKEPGTPCIHLPQTHLLIKLMRQVLDLVVPGTILLTETNVPHAENVSYFGDGDEAQMVYNFALPPLLLHALVTGNGQWLTRWARDLSTPPVGCTFLNFTASHDGIGVRPAQGILPDKEIEKLVKRVRQSGGKVSSRSLPDGSEAPYELNTTWFSALATGSSVPTDVDQQKFLCSQALAMSLAGIPAIYIHSLFGSRNDTEAVKRTGHNRAINRRKLLENEVEDWLANADDHHGKVFRTITELLRRRNKQPCFHPDAYQLVHDCGEQLFVVERRTNDQQSLLCVFNLTAEEQQLELASCGWPEAGLVDVASERPVDVKSGALALGAYEFAWLQQN